MLLVQASWDLQQAWLMTELISLSALRTPNTLTAHFHTANTNHPHDHVD